MFKVWRKTYSSRPSDSRQRRPISFRVSFFGCVCQAAVTTETDWGEVFLGEETFETLVVRVVSTRASSSTRFSRQTDRRTNGQTDGHRHRLKPSL